MGKHFAAIYARTNMDPRSVREQRRISDQIEKCVSLAVCKGYSQEEIHIYKDEGVSGLAPIAPGRERLFEEIENYDLLVLPTLSRLSRDPFLLAVATRVIREAGIHFCTCDGQIDDGCSQLGHRDMVERHIAEFYSLMLARQGTTSADH